MSAKTTKKTNSIIQKTVHRRIEVPPTRGAVYSHSVMGCRLPQTAAPQKPQNAEPSTSYAQPKWNSVMRQVHALETLQAMQPPKYKSTAELTPRTKATIAPKITQKLNFNAGHTVFKNLMPLNVNDSILLPTTRPTSIRKKYPKANKAPVPELGDFLEPLPPLTHVIPEPEIQLEFPKQDFDYFGCYLRLYDATI